jgi:hypothetical protein
MPEEHEEHLSRKRQLHERLLGHLQAAGAPRWPGADGLMVQEVLGSYPEDAAADLVPDRQALLLLYPHLADVIGEFFAEEDRVGNPSHPDR